VESFYPTLGSPSARTHITSFYIKPTLVSPQKPDITLNGNVMSDPLEVQKIFETQIPKAYYEVQSFDCHVVNPNYNVSVDDSALGPNKDGKKMSIVVMVSGSVKYFKSSDDEEARAELRGFTETFVLVPNQEAQNPKAAKGIRKWLIQSQNFRLVL
jgi:NTF2-related export protein 1/2